MWKKDSQSISSGDESFNLLAGRDVNLFLGKDFPRDLVDQKIGDEVEKLRKARFFREFDRIRSSLMLGRRIIERELSGGSDEVRSRGLAWCSRLLSYSAELDKAEEFAKRARTLGDCPEIKVAEAFIVSHRGDKAAALKALACIDSPSTHSAGLMIVAHHDGAKGAIKWMGAAGFKAKDLDSDGKNFLLMHQLELAHWDDGAETLAALTEVDFKETPILHHWTALTMLLTAVPADFRAMVLKQVPLEVSRFPLASDALAMNARRAAHGHFLDAVEVAQRLGCPSAAKLDDEYALWIELRDPAWAAQGRNRLEAKLRDPKSALSVIHFALQFGVKLNLDAVERDIEQQVAINGGMTIDTAIARFALAFTQKTPEEVSNYIARYYDQLSGHIDTKMMQFCQIEMLSLAGLSESANECLAKLIEQGISAKEEKRLRSIIAEAEGNDPIEARKAQYKITKNLGDLINLLYELETHQHWDEVCKYGTLLFKNTRSLRDAERLVNGFNNTQRSGELVEFLNENSELLSQSKMLRMSYAWGLYNEGALIESRAELLKLSDESESPSYRDLQVNLGIAMGDWSSLLAYVTNEYQNRKERSARDLIGTAQLALHLGSPHAADLVSAAAGKAGKDPAILAGACYLAFNAGFEDDPEVYQWLEKAAELSGDDGPLQRMSLKDVFEKIPEWDRRESETWRLLMKGEIPIFLAAQSLNRTLIDLTIFPALSNLSENDPRRRNPIPAYSGKRLPEHIDVAGKTVAIDATALLTLSFLKILDKTLDVFKRVYIPHSTLGWLFEERQQAAFHQPSRIRDAHKLRNFLSTDVLEKFAPTTVANSNLSAQVGDELATLIAEAEKIREGENTQRIVVRSSPVHRLSTLMKEEADLSPHSAVLSSCLAVVGKLRKKGQITVEEEKRARAYLQLKEKPWPNQPTISDGAILYLDGLAITYLLHLGMLGKLKSTGLRVVASPRAVSEATALISYEGISEEVKAAIERIRASLSSRIKSGQIRVGRRNSSDETKEKSIQQHPTFSIIALAHYCDSVIVDDRFINQHANINYGSTQAPIFSTLDLMDALVSADVISEADWLEYRTQLRRAGYFFVPVSEAELYRFLEASDVLDGNVVETAELKAIRESVLRVRMSDWLQLPKEALWLDTTLKEYIRVLKKLWVNCAVIDEVTARSNWIADQVDVRGWAHSFDPEGGDNVVRLGRGAFILLLLTRLSNAQHETVDAYWSWVEEKILTPVKEQFPDLYAWLVEWHRKQFSEMVVTEGDAS